MRDYLDELKSLDINYFVKEKHKWKKRAVGIEISYTLNTHSGEGEDVSYYIPIEWRKVNFGGERAFFLCPHCGRMAVKLYYWGKYFLYRKCVNIPYRSQYECVESRLIGKYKKIEAKMNRKGIWKRNKRKLSREYDETIHKLAVRMGIRD